MIYITKLEMADGAERWFRLDRHEHRYSFPFSLFYKSPEIHYMTLGDSKPTRDALIAHLKSRFSKTDWSDPVDVDYKEVVHSCDWHYCGDLGL